MVVKSWRLCAGGSPKVQLVVRLQGNNVEGAMELMKK
jgi:succinyl-CoA synthetase beta subunit